MRTAHEPRKYRRIPHTGIEDSQRRRRGTQEAKFLSGAARYGGFLIAGVDEREIFLAVIIETEGRDGGGRRRNSGCRGPCDFGALAPAGAAHLFLSHTHSCIRPGPLPHYHRRPGNRSQQVAMRVVFVKRDDVRRRKPATLALYRESIANQRKI
jgi:hypothetical protein